MKMKQKLKIFSFKLYPFNIDVQIYKEFFK